jgi:hypothetical protein
VCVGGTDGRGATIERADELAAFEVGHSGREPGEYGRAQRTLGRAQGAPAEGVNQASARKQRPGQPRHDGASRRAPARACRQESLSLSGPTTCIQRHLPVLASLYLLQLPSVELGQRRRSFCHVLRAHHVYCIAGHGQQTCLTAAVGHRCLLSAKVTCSCRVSHFATTDTLIYYVLKGPAIQSVMSTSPPELWESVLDELLDTTSLLDLIPLARRSYTLGTNAEPSLQQNLCLRDERGLMEMSSLSPPSSAQPNTVRS